MAAGLYIALVTPFSWSSPSAVNQHVADLARELRARGHLPVVVVSSDHPRDEKRLRSLFHRSRGQVITLLSHYRRGGPAAQLLLPSAGAGPLGPEEGIPVIPLGSSLPIRFNGAVANLGLPLDVTSRIEKLLLGAEFDLLHVHEPLAPSLSFTALREARSPVVATFHLTPLGVAAYEMAQGVLDRFFLRLDARVVTFPSGRGMMDDLFPGTYEVLSCGTRIVPGKVAHGAVAPPAGRFALYVYRGDSRRPYRALVRTLVAAFPSRVECVVVALHRPSVAKWEPRGVPRKLASRLLTVDFDRPEELASFYETAAVAILPFLGGEWLGATAAEALICRCPVAGPDLPPVRDLLEEGPEAASPRAASEAGAVFSATESGSLRAAIADALDATPWPRPPSPAEDSPAEDDSRHQYSMAWVAERLEGIYRETLASTSARRGNKAKTPVAGYSLHVRGIGEAPPRRRLRHAAAGPLRPDWINADLHIHSNYSKDCASSVESILATAREIGLGALAIADHNEIDGAFLAQELARGDPFVIAAEEIKTAEGEVIGLFLKKVIPPGLSFDDTLSLIKEQGGLVYVPHPFDSMRTTPSYRALVDNLHRIDVIEIYNAKVAFASFNLSAERFAAKYNIVAGAGSDAHVLQGLGTAIIRMPRFTNPQTFMAALWEADIIARRKSLLYLQSLKLLQTTLDRVFPEG
jgi:predicted metal-dependent phosphoesterase TrpH/glycosyltransferase involved in cell wall biosynthesis